MTLLSALAGDPEIEALLSDAAQLDAMLAFERALAEASAETGFISEDAAAAIGGAVTGFTPDCDGLEAGMAQDGVVVLRWSNSSSLACPSRTARLCTRAPPARTSPTPR